MKWLNQLERKYRRYAIRDLMTYIVVLNVVVAALTFLVPQSNLIGRFALIPEYVLRGEVWRLFTFLTIPPAMQPLWLFFALYIYYLVGSSLERQWGSFRFNIYYLIGWLATLAAAFISGQTVYATHLNLSLFLAFAYLFPNFEFQLFFILPVKVKYLAWLNWFFIGWTVLTGFLPDRLAAAASTVNYFIFFGPDLIKNIKSRRQVMQNRRRFNSAMRNQKKN